MMEHEPFSGYMYNFYTKEKFDKNDFYKIDIGFYFRYRDYNFTWEFLFERFREYEYLIGLKESAIGKVKLNFLNNCIRKIKNIIDRNRIKKREEKKYEEFKNLSYL